MVRSWSLEAVVSKATRCPLRCGRIITGPFFIFSFHFENEIKKLSLTSI